MRLDVSLGVCSSAQCRMPQAYMHDLYIHSVSPHYLLTQMMKISIKCSNLTSDDMIVFHIHCTYTCVNIDKIVISNAASHLGFPWHFL